MRGQALAALVEPLGRQARRSGTAVQRPEKSGRRLRGCALRQQRQRRHPQDFFYSRHKHSPSLASSAETRIVYAQPDVTPAEKEVAMSRSRLVVAHVALTWLIRSSPASAQASRPNIVIMYADNLGFGEVGDLRRRPRRADAAAGRARARGPAAHELQRRDVLHAVARRRCSPGGTASGPGRSPTGCP